MNYKFLSKNGPTLAFALFVVCVVISIVPILSGLTEFSELPAERQAYAEPSKIFLPGLYLTYGLLWVGVIVAIVLALLQVITNPKASKKALISFGIIALGFLLLYFLADAKGTGALAGTIEKFSIGEGVSKIISGGLQLSVIMLLASVALTIAMEIWNFFKNQ